MLVIAAIAELVRPFQSGRLGAASVSVWLRWHLVRLPAFLGLTLKLPRLEVGRAMRIEGHTLRLLCRVRLPSRLVSLERHTHLIIHLLRLSGLEWDPLQVHERVLGQRQR